MTSRKVCLVPSTKSVQLYGVHFFRFWQQFWSHSNYTRPLRVSGGQSGCKAFWTGRWTVLSRCSQQTRARHHLLWADVVRSERKVVVDAQSQDKGRLWKVLRRTGQNRTSTCPQSHHQKTAFVSLLLFLLLFPRTVTLLTLSTFIYYDCFFCVEK